jgi:hypothetical protein
MIHPSSATNALLLRYPLEIAIMASQQGRRGAHHRCESSIADHKPVLSLRTALLAARCDICKDGTLAIN